MSSTLQKWILFLSLSFIWGSSFILMKKGLEHLTAFQVASVRIVLSGLLLIPISIRGYRHIPREKIVYVFLSGSLGSLLPAYLFCFAETRIDSALAGMLNSLTPVFVIITGVMFFKMKPSFRVIFGITIALSGSVLLFLSRSESGVNSDIDYIVFVVAATICYGLNVNLVHRYLHNIPSLQVVAMALSLNAIPALVALYLSGYFSLDFRNTGVISSTLFTFLLGAGGTVVASLLFYVLIKKAGVVFSSMVTYGIPFVAIFWGIIFKETTGWMQIFSLIIILIGVYLTNRKPSPSVKA